MKLSTTSQIITNRISWVDHARGIAILLVVYRHVVVGMRRSGIVVTEVTYNLQEVFYNFRMPVFFVLSGVFIAASLRKKSAISILRDRAETILYPYILWAFILVSLEIVLSEYTNAKRGLQDYWHIIAQPRAIDHLWYLFALFNTTLLYLILGKIIKPLWLHLPVSLVLHALTFQGFLQGKSLISDAFYFYPFFLTGAILTEFFLNPQKSSLFFNSRTLLWLVPLFVAGQWFWFRHRDDEKGWYLLFFFINLIACYMVYIIAREMARHSFFNGLSYIGKYSLYIYILHVPLAAGVRNIFLKGQIQADSFIILFFCWMIGIIVPVIAINLVKNTRFLLLFSLKSKPTI